MKQDSLQIGFLAAEKRVFSKLNMAKKGENGIIWEIWAIISLNCPLHLVIFLWYGVKVFSDAHLTEITLKRVFVLTHYRWNDNLMKCTRIKKTPCINKIGIGIRRWKEEFLTVQSWRLSFCFSSRMSFDHSSSKTAYIMTFNFNVGSAIFFWINCEYTQSLKCHF